MNITIDWPYFLGIMGALIGIAWYSSARFTAIETSMSWVKETLNDLKVSTDNANTSAPAFGSGSPIDLKPIGEQWLIESGLKEYIETNKDELMKICEEKRGSNPYEVQKHIFKTFDMFSLPSEFEDKLKKFAFEKGTTMGILRRVGAIHIRNLCLTDFGMNKDDIDKHAPKPNEQK
ncbi:MAG: hypothetical protein WAP52_00920 [Candidatus Sungiibacteriota bacterium]